MFNILIVDDREIFRRQFKRIPIIKNNNNFIVNYEAQNGDEALKILKNNQVDVVITDIRMPVMDGLELLKNIKDEKLCNCVVLLSEYTDFTYAKKGLVLGAFDFIVKPINAEKLTELLERVEEYLTNIENTETFTENETSMLSSLIIDNDNYAIDVAKQIFNRISEIKNNSPIQIDMEIRSIFTKICNNIKKQRPWLELYLDLDQLFNVSAIRSDNVETMKNNFQEYIRKVVYEVNKFNVSSRSSLIQNMCSYILLNIENSDINLKNIAEKFYVNKTYLSHIFKIEMGISFVDYVTFIKMERAKNILRKSDIKIYELANRLGYDDAEYFSKIFKKNTGVSAISYKKINLN